MRRLLVGMATAGLFAVLVAPAALAAPAVVDSSPADGAEEHEAPDSVSITFDIPLDPSASLIKVVDECGRQIDAENTTVQLNEMSVDIAKKPSGLYKAFYHAAAPAGATGTSNGSISFTVHGGPACGPEAKTHHQGGGSGTDNEGGGHDGHQSGSGGHNGGHDDSTSHTTDASGSTSHTDHSSATGHTTPLAGGNHTAHGKAHQRNVGHGKHGSGNASVASGNGPGPRAAGGDEFALNDGQAILVSLGVCLLLGVAGGWMIRTTQAPRKTA